MILISMIYPTDSKSEDVYNEAAKTISLLMAFDASSILLCKTGSPMILAASFTSRNVSCNC